MDSNGAMDTAMCKEVATTMRDGAVLVSSKTTREHY